MGDMRYVLTKYKKGVLSFTLDSKTNKMETVNFTRYSEISDNAKIGDIFVAKVVNVAKQIHAAFIDYAPDKRDICRFIPIIFRLSQTANMMAEF